MAEHFPATSPLEVWGGIEGTVNRVGDRYFDQLARSGHDRRLDDLDRFAALGLRAIRYPVLWERTAPRGPDSADWSWPDARLGRLRELGLRPIVGLVHHGSGPPDTSLLDPAFPERLAAYAGAVARRYPWITDYTPVNEPLTTARFAALYGHWYPHARSDRSFARALLNECRAVALAMRAIRDVNPGARLVQTDDLGKVYSTPELAYQAEYENERRWLTFDLLCGHLTEQRPMWHWLVGVGIEPEELDWFAANPCPPDLVGINTYLSSERYLDERCDLYPGEPPGSNGQHRYVDVLAARVLPEGIAGAEGLLQETWKRFRRPLAITEAHNGSTREEQMRWLADVWGGAKRARDAGVDVRAVTAWALLGSFDWPSLVTRDDGAYEPGVFDVRAPVPRPTALAHMVGNLAGDGYHDHPVLAVPGWWRRPDRFLVPNDDAPAHKVSWPDEARPILIAGEFGALAAALTDACARRAIPVCIENSLPVGGIAATGEWAVIDTGRLEPLPATPGATVPLARPLPDGEPIPIPPGISVVCLSSDLVFGGTGDGAFTEADAVAPVDEAGRRTVAAERRLLAARPDALIVRTGPIFGPGIPPSGSADVGRADEEVSPTYLPDLADAVLDLLLDAEHGIWHVANAGATTLGAFQRAATRRDDWLSPNERATPPARSRALTSGRGWLLPDWQVALARHIGADGG